LIFLPIPDPGVKKAPDPGTGSATLIYFSDWFHTISSAAPKVLKTESEDAGLEALNPGLVEHGI
jgi:hypothetical protein